MPHAPNGDGRVPLGPRWAAARYGSLVEVAERDLGWAERLMAGGDVLPVPFGPQSLLSQAPEFHVRLAEVCVQLCDELASGSSPQPRSVTGLIMLDTAAQHYVDVWEGKEMDTVDMEAMDREWSHLPKSSGDFNLDALWMLDYRAAEWEELVDRDNPYEPYSMDGILDAK